MGDRHLGVWCTQNEVFLSVAVNGAIADGYTERIEGPALFEASERLEGLLDRISRAFDEIQPATIRILMPEQTYRAAYTKMAARAGLETLVRLAAVRRHIPVEVLARVTLRVRLKLPKHGSVDAHLGSVLPEPTGKYWAAGRNLAAAAALADS